MAKPSYPYPVEHSDTGARLTMSSLDNIMDADKPLTWVKQHVVTATDWSVRRMDGDERREGPTEGLEPALKITLLKSAHKAIEPKGKPDGAAPMPPHIGNILSTFQM